MKTHKIATFMITVLLLLTLFVVQVAAQVVGDINFEIDGNTAPEPPPATSDDWETVILGGEPDWDAGPGTLIRDGNSGPKSTLPEQNIFAKGGKFGDPAGWIIEPGNSPAQNDLTNVMVYPVLDSLSGDTWIVMGMERIKKQGTFDLDFEFNQQAWEGTSGTLQRTPGDIAVGFELSGNPEDPEADLTVLILVYDPNNTSCTGWDSVYGDGWCVVFSGAASVLEDEGAATMNSVSFPAPPWGSVDSAGNPVTTIQPFFFAEAAINLTELNIDVGCPGFGSVHAKSRSSLEITADMKDLAGPVRLDISCFIEGYKFHDKDADGTWDQPAEPGLGGWTINLYDNGNLVDTTTTADGTGDDPLGYYRFDGLSDGTYRVVEVCPADWFQSYPTPTNGCGSGEHTGILIDVNNRSASDINFGDYQNATKAGYKFHDLDADGVWEPNDNELGLNGWTINVFESDGTTLVTSTTTANDSNGDPGYYEFSLPPGSYVVAEACPDSTWFQSFPGPNPATSCGNNTYAITLISQGQDLDNDFGNYQNATKAGYKFYDLNADGVWQLGADGEANTGDSGEEPTLPNWAICANSTCTTTDADGYYEFSLTPGSYTVSETCPADEVWIQSFPGPNPAASCGANTHQVTLTSGQEDLDNNFGNYQEATQSGVKFKDVNADGIWDPDGADDIGGNTDDEVGLEGWTIKIYNDNDGSGDLSTGDTVEDTKTTDANGAYSFTVIPGDYLICEVAQANWAQTAPSGIVCEDDSVDDTLASNGYAVTLVGGEDDSDKDFGNTPLSTFEVNFFDLTGFTDATIVCSAGTSSTDEDASPETTLTAEGVTIGEYTCTITITDP